LEICTDNNCPRLFISASSRICGLYRDKVIKATSESDNALGQ